ncbi:hypothetical protein C8R47DRAFT_124367 [Mycena vitilis]|nr:hypothetical protein C8R47DRAFT_124367 [Mycena vitilis]
MVCSVRKEKEIRGTTVVLYTEDWSHLESVDDNRTLDVNPLNKALSCSLVYSVAFYFAPPRPRTTSGRPFMTMYNLVDSSYALEIHRLLVVLIPARALPFSTSARFAASTKTKPKAEDPIPLRTTTTPDNFLRGMHAFRAFTVLALYLAISFPTASAAAPPLRTDAHEVARAPEPEPEPACRLYACI